ncbi:MAG: DUF1579 domain-containing protein [bacterium]|nr:DUF1579 domain-containing protein [bacterium]
MKAILTLFAIPALAWTTTAQEGPQGPAAEMQKLGVMLGHWSGSGTASPAPDTEAMNWTATTHVERIVGGHAVRETVHVEFPVPGFPPVDFVNLLAWNREAGRYTSMSVSNMSAGTSTEAFWLDANTLVINQSDFVEGQPVIERTITRYSGDKYAFTVERAQGTGPFHKYIQGSFERTQPPEGAKTIEASIGASKLAPALNKMSKMLGSWKVQGKMSPGPGVPEMSFTGTETILPALGGGAFEARILGDANESGFVYEGVWYMCWNDRDGAYDTFLVSNMGEVGHSQGRLADNEFIVADGLTQMGTPVANRMVLRLGENGIESVIGHAMHGSKEPMKVFEAKYERLK